MKKNWLFYPKICAWLNYEKKKKKKKNTNRLLVQLPSYIIKTKAIAVFSLELENKNFYSPFLGKMGNTTIFNGP